MKALIIDDSRAMRAVLKGILQEAGMETVEANHGKEGLERLKGSGVDLVLVDWHMPEMDGFAFVRALRGSAAFHSLPVLMVTSEGDTDMIVKALEAGADEYVLKPFTKDSIVQKLQTMGVPVVKAY
jgi:two-component system chemotaxis response regulator CheY